MTEGPGNHAVRTDRWRYVHYSDGAEELYDHSKDLWEHNNLLGSVPEAEARKHIEPTIKSLRERYRNDPAKFATTASRALRDGLKELRARRTAQFSNVVAAHRRWLPEKEAPGKGMSHLYEPPPPPGAGLPGSGYSKKRAAGGDTRKVERAKRTRSAKK